MNPAPENTAENNSIHNWKFPISAGEVNYKMSNKLPLKAAAVAPVCRKDHPGAAVRPQVCFLRKYEHGDKVFSLRVATMKQRNSTFFRSAGDNTNNSEKPHLGRFNCHVYYLPLSPPDAFWRLESGHEHAR